VRYRPGFRTREKAETGKILQGKNQIPIESVVAIFFGKSHPDFAGKTSLEGSTRLTDLFDEKSTKS